MAPVSDVAFEALKDRVIDLERSQAVKTATDASIDDRLTKIESALSRLTWILIGGIGSAFVGFIINGGLVPLGGN